MKLACSAADSLLLACSAAALGHTAHGQQHTWFAVRCFAQAALQHLQACSPSGRSRRRCTSISNSNASTSPHSSADRCGHGSTEPPTNVLHLAGRRLSGQLQQWQHVAQLSQDDVQQVLLQHPPLQAYLNSSNFFQPSNYLVNLACLSLHPGQLDTQQHAALRGILALVPPSMLQTLLQEQPRLQELLQQYHQHTTPQHQQQRPELNALAQLYELLLHSLGPLRAQQQEQWTLARPYMQQQQQKQSLGLQTQQHLGTVGWERSQLQHDGQGNQTRQHQQQHQAFHSFQQVAEAVVTALGLRPDHLPDIDKKLLQLLHKATERVHDSCSSSSTGSTPSSPSSNNSSSSFSSAVARRYTTRTATVTSATGLAHALQATARALTLRNKPLHEAATAAAFAQQLQHSTGLDGTDVLRLLLQRPAMLWQHKTPCPPQQLLSELQLLLPDLNQQGALAQLVLQQPGLLSCRPEGLAAVVDMMATRLQLSQEQAAQLVQQHPRLLVRPVKQMLPNIGFLVGLGMTAPDLRAMALKSPKWLTSSLRDLTVQWHFIQQVVKSSRQDLVLFPQLLTLPIKTCLGPRVLYARKRQIKLLAPSLAALVGRGCSTAAREEWKEHKMVPLDFWLMATERQMCAALGLNLEDYKRFKAAWGRVDGANWYRLTHRHGNQQLVLSGMNAK